MTVHPSTRSARLGVPAGVSLTLHASLVAVAIVFSRGSRASLPPVYKVDLVAAPAGERAIGTVPQTPTPPPEAPQPTPRRAETRPSDMPAPTAKPPARRETARATPVPNAKSARLDAPAPRAGGGPTGGAGTDVANVKTEGIEFPYQSYLENIVRQIALRFKPGNAGALRADVVFLIRRDGSVSGFSFRTRSGSYAFDLEAQGAVEAAGRSGSFGPLPEGFKDDVLTIIFSFDPQLIR